MGPRNSRPGSSSASASSTGTKPLFIQKGKASDSYSWKDVIKEKSHPLCKKYGKKHIGVRLASTHGCYGSGKTGNKLRDYPSSSRKGRDVC